MDEASLERVLSDYNDFYISSQVRSRVGIETLAYTLACRRSIMPWRSCDVIDGQQGLLRLPTTKPARATSSSSLAAVFTGQGVQYIKMGLGLVRISPLS